MRDTTVKLFEFIVKKLREIAIEEAQGADKN
jgi:hypothetical protein